MTSRLLPILVLLTTPLMASAQPDRNAQFDRLDRNRDGVLTTDELRWRAVFGRLDGNQDGKVTREEFTQGARRMATRSKTPPLAAGIVKVADVGYGTDHARQTLDVYRAQAPAPSADRPAGSVAPGERRVPVLIWVHGGAWMIGDKRSSITTKANYFVPRGYLLVSINYYLLKKGSGKLPHPQNVSDVARAVDWVIESAARYGGDPGRIVLMGHSAGAHLVALAGTDARRLKAFGHTLEALRGVVPIDVNAYDLVATMPTRTGTNKTLFETAFGTDPAHWRDASPQQQIDAGAGTPPFLIVHAMPDAGPASKRFAAALRAAGGHAETLHARGYSHRDVNVKIGTDALVTPVITRFLERVTRTPPAARKPGDAESALDEALK